MVTLIRHLSGIANGMSIRLNKLCYGKLGEKEFKKSHPANYELLEQNSEFKDLHKGKRCFIVGNGPSLNKQDLSLLASEYVFTANYIYKNAQFGSMKSNYHFFSDPICFNAEKHLPEEFTAICTENNKPVCFLPLFDGSRYAKETGLDSTLSIRYLFDFVPFEEPLDVRSDITKGITGMHTVIQTAIIVAAYMGFSEIYLIGCDCTGIITNIDTLLNKQEVGGYSYKFTAEEKQNLIDEYKSRLKISDTFSGWAKMFIGYERLLNYYKAKNIKLLNATEGGILNSIPRVDFNTLF